MATFERTRSGVLDTPADVVVVGAGKGPQLTRRAMEVDHRLGGALARHLDRIRFKGDVGDVGIFPASGELSAGSALVVGLGEGDATHEEVRKAAAVAARHSRGCETVALALADGVEAGLQATVEGFALGSYQFSRYKSEPEVPKTRRVLVLGDGSEAEVGRAQVLAEATNWARDLVNDPSGFRGPQGFAEAARRRAESAGVGAEIFDESAMGEMGMNGILGVGQGSAAPPRFLVLRYEPEGATRFVGAVGKGITFDSGGLSIKTADAMETMKTDCSGGAAVVAAVTALPALGTRIKVWAAVPLAENMPGGGAIKPGDVIRHYGGRTSEVLNTDAEGRLVLADALAWMAEQEPEAMVDLATLTGGIVIALGQKVAGLFCNRRELAAEILEAAARTGERLWEMPLIDDLRKDLDSDVADIKNVASRYGSPIFGALFLRDFVGDVAWAHLDIAGPARSEKEEHYLPKGATGVGTRLLIDWLEHKAGA